MSQTETAPKSETPPSDRPARQAPQAKVWEPTAKLAETMQEIRDLGLGDYIVELDEKGYTIIPPDKMGDPGAERILEAILRIAEEESGVRPDLETGGNIMSTVAERGVKTLFPFQDTYDDLLVKDRVFEEALLNRTMLALVTYLLGEHAELSNKFGCWLRGPVPAPPDLIPPTLHSDNYGVPSPFPPYAQVCNATWAITDYTRAGGALGFVPGSHKLQRHPLNTAELIDQWVPAEAPAGSLIFWHGNTWHTIGNPRTIPGVRVSMSMVFCRPYMLPINRYTDVPQEIIDRNPPRFARLLGLHNRYFVGGNPTDNQVGDNGVPGAPSIWA